MTFPRRPLAAACLSILMLAGASGAKAQPPSAETASVAPAPPIDPERLRLARAVFEAQGGLANISSAIDQTFDAMFRGAAFEGPNGDLARAAAKDAVKDILPRLLDLEAEVYAETFDAHQLSDLLAFYQSPTGRVMRDKLPELSGRTGAVMAKIMPQMTLNILERVCSQATCSDQQQRAMANLKAALGQSAP